MYDFGTWHFLIFSIFLFDEIDMRDFLFWQYHDAYLDAWLMLFISRFGDTPFKRSIESPSAWKSPWFINSFVPGPRIDTEISIEVHNLF